MSAFGNAKRFFETLESLAGWAGCRELVSGGATFTCQADALADVKTVEGYCEWVKGFGSVTAPGATYDLHAASWDEERRTATFVATYHAKHTGDGGPVPPTHKQTDCDYVYSVVMGPDDKVQRMTKIWNDVWAVRELGWV